MSEPKKFGVVLVYGRPDCGSKCWPMHTHGPFDFKLLVHSPENGTLSEAKNVMALAIHIEAEGLPIARCTLMKAEGIEKFAFGRFTQEFNADHEPLFLSEDCILVDIQRPSS